jgi:uncharacterized protein
MKRYTVVIVVALVAGCASAGFRYHTLQPAVDAPAGSTTKFKVRLTEVQIPAELDTEQLVVRESGNTLIREPNDRWAAPLTDEIRAALDDAWRRDYALEDVQGVVGAPHSVPLVAVQIQELDAKMGADVELVATWWVSLDQAQAIKSWSCQRVFLEHTGSGVDELVDAQQRVLRSLAGAMASSVIAISNRQVPLCMER